MPIPQQGDNGADRFTGIKGRTVDMVNSLAGVEYLVTNQLAVFADKLKTTAAGLADF